MAALFFKTLIFYPNELRSVIQLKVMRDPVNDIEQNPKTSGWDRPTMRRCYELMDQTSRSFGFVIKELQGDLVRAIAVFYVVLRALDTIEDDMTINIKTKVEELTHFYERVDQPGWSFDGCGPNEKDRNVLVEFPTVIEEFQKLDEKYQIVIRNTARKMGAGMAHYALEAESNSGVYSINSLADFDLYCHYVAGILGEGLSGIFSASELERADLAKQLTLSNSMGLMLQKTNVMRDFREDVDGGRLFWPKEIWAREGISSPKQLLEPHNKTKALNALSAIILDAATHSIDSLTYISLLKNQSIFNFCAVPQIMAIATLAECFENYDVFKRNVKIRRSLAASLIVNNTNPIHVCYTYVRFLKIIHSKVRPSDPSHIKWVVLIGQIEQWVETRYPSWVRDLTDRPGQIKLPSTAEDAKSLGIADARARQLPSTKPPKSLIPAIKGVLAVDDDAPLTGLQTAGVCFLFAAIFFGMIAIPLYLIGFFDQNRVVMDMASPYKDRGGFN